MVGFESKLKKVESKFSNAVSIFTKTMQKLESTKDEYLAMKAEISRERETLVSTEKIVDEKLTENEALLKNFKSLLK